MTPPGGEHGDRTMRFSVPFGHYVYTHDLGIVLAAETGFKIDNYNVRAPDCALISKKRVQQYGVPKSFFPFAPDLTVEVVSPGDTKAEVKEKVEWWLAVGTRMVLVIDPKRRSVTSHHAESGSVAEYKVGDTLDGMDVVPGFSLPVEDIFK